MDKFPRADYVNGECEELLEIRSLLESISGRQRRKFWRFGIVPVNLLVFWWKMGFLPGRQAPSEGMRIPRLLEWLERGPYFSPEHQERGRWFYEKIVIEELTPRRLPGKERMVGARKHVELMPISEIKKNPGTILG